MAHGHVCRIREKMNGRAFKRSSIKIRRKTANFTALDKARAIRYNELSIFKGIE